MSIVLAFPVHLTNHPYTHTSKAVAWLKIDTAVINYVTTLDNVPKYVHTVTKSGAFGVTKKRESEIK